MNEELRWQDWRRARHAELSGPESWLGLVGLFWLEAGVNRVGSADDCPVRLPEGPAHLGDLNWQDERLTWLPAGAPPRDLQTDVDGQPSVVAFDNGSFFVVDREGRLAVRLRDRAWSGKRHFTGVGYFDYDPAWRIDAAWLPLSPPVQMEVPNVSGDLKRVEVSHQAVFEVGGQTVRLLPMSVSDTEVFFIFRDRTSGKESYGAGRFLKATLPATDGIADPAVNGKISLNFNFAYNPPCAFTPFATCPLPPAENWLSFAVPAGEQKWSGQ